MTKPTKPAKPTKPTETDPRSQDDKLEDELDEALEDTFPASDPVSIDPRLPHAPERRKPGHARAAGQAVSQGS